LRQVKRSRCHRRRPPSRRLERRFDVHMMFITYVTPGGGERELLQD
jgi:hypothetical protein